MLLPGQDPQTLNSAQIARLCGVGRAAVMNWRQRSPDFPPPAGGTEASPLFDRVAALEWLRLHDRLATHWPDHMIDGIPVPDELRAARIEQLRGEPVTVP